MNNPFEIGADRYQPDQSFQYAANSQVRLDQRKLAFLVGLVAVGLPIVLGAGAAVGEQVCFYDSISHFYYSQLLGDVFVGCLIFIGAFLIVYQADNRNEGRLATIAGISAFGVALFPTSGRGCPEESFSGRALVDMTRRDDAEFVTMAQASESTSIFELFGHAEILHFAAAALLFAFLAYYAFFVFTRVTPDQRLSDGSLTDVKRRRNQLYGACGALILFSMIALGLNALLGLPNWNETNLTFWFETVALLAFGFSWMVKGRFFGTQLLDERERQDWTAI